MNKALIQNALILFGLMMIINTHNAPVISWGGLECVVGIVMFLLGLDWKTAQSITKGKER